MVLRRRDNQTATPKDLFGGPIEIARKRPQRAASSDNEKLLPPRRSHDGSDD
jgi:hypothetical protein